MIAATSVSLAGCSAAVSGLAQPTSTTGAPTSSDSSTEISTGSSIQAPRVADPLDATRFVNDPCSALTAPELTAIDAKNAVASGPVNTVGNTGCSWSGESGGGINIGWQTAESNGLSDLYAHSGMIAYWQPTTVAGYPAAHGDPLGDNRSLGACMISVAVNDHLYFESDYTGPNADTSCALARQAAADVIKNLSGS
jgi:hypothetical protein